MSVREAVLSSADISTALLPRAEEVPAGNSRAWHDRFVDAIVALGYYPDEESAAHARDYSTSQIQAAIQELRRHGADPASYAAHLASATLRWEERCAYCAAVPLLGGRRAESRRAPPQ